MNTTYVFDSSSMMHLFREGHYDARIFPTLWEKFDAEVVRADRVFFVRETRREIKHPQSAIEWIEEHRDLELSPTSAETEFLRGDLFQNRHYRGLIRVKKIRKGQPVADPFVIAQAKVNGRCVVTEERKKENAPCIPVICDHYNIEWTNLVGFMAKEGWSFR